jgi:hypothetical protein
MAGTSEIIKIALTAKKPQDPHCLLGWGPLPSLRIYNMIVVNLDKNQKT